MHVEATGVDVRIRNTAVRSSTILHIWTTIKQQDRLTSCAGSLRPRESTGNSEDKASDSMFCTKMQTPISSRTRELWLTSGQLSQRRGRKVRDLVARTARIPVVQLGHLLTRCSYQRLQLGDARNDCCWIFHDLVHVGADQTTSSYSFLHWVIETT